jgi:eukaryotic-like serine/threonine-protein kinase
LAEHRTDGDAAAGVAAARGPDRLGEIFERAVGLDPIARAALLDAECGADAALRAELESLIACHLAAPDFLERLGERVLAPSFAGLAHADLAAGAMIGRYEIMGPLGSGGMGDVYCARDTTLHRVVALKFLPAHRTSDAVARARLVAEARAASALDHPNVAVVHDVAETPAAPDGGPWAGRLYIAMAYYPGETLREKIARGPLPYDEALDYAVQLAAGLARAHEAGIVHRDIKPANIVVTDRGQVRIVDFGVATVAGDSAASAQHAGTIAYMSPEQTRGDAVDARADVWAAGAVLYEMVTGVRPFEGGTVDVVIDGIRHRHPPSPITLRPELPRTIERIIRRCLGKRPGERYTSAVSLRADLRAAVASMAGQRGTVDGEASLLVLPFTDIDPGAGHEYLAAGLTEEVISELGRVRALRVIARASAMRLGGTGREAVETARELGVHYVLEGRVRSTGDLLRVSARFSDARDGVLIWARSFDGTLSDVFEVQEQVARAIVTALRLRLSDAESRALGERPIGDARAYESYLRARYEAWRFSSDGLDRATRYIRAALEIVGDNELLYGTLGHITAMHLEAGIDAGADALGTVEEMAERVFALNPRSARGHWLRSFAAFQRGDVPAAVRAGEQALALAPDDADTLLLLGYVCAHAGLNDRARALLDRALLIDPLTPLTQCMPGFVAVLEGRFADAVAPYRRLFEMDPESPFAAVTCGWVLGYNGRTAEAVSILEDAARRFPGTAFASWAESLACGLRDDRDGAARAITPAFRAAAERSEMFARALAQCCALAGLADEALHWAEREVELGMWNHAYLAVHDAYLAALWHEPRFQSLLERVRTKAAALQGTHFRERA